MKHQIAVSLSIIAVLLIALPASAQTMNVEMGTTFTCTNNAECKRKCEGLGGTWRPNPGGSTHGSCSLRRISLSELLLVSRDTLKEEKNVRRWTAVDVGGDQRVTDTDDADDGHEVVFLTPSECEALGGDVDFHRGCSGTLLKCTTKDSNGTRRAMCIDEIDTIIEQPEPDPEPSE